MAELKTYVVEVKQRDSAEVQAALRAFGVKGSKVYRVMAVGADTKSLNPTGGEVGLLVAPCNPELDQ
jgi:hypothetical protein